jgi:hypothetical protein
MKIAFLSSPYRAETEAEMTINKGIAWNAAVKLWKLGYGVLCPVLNSAGMSGIVEEEKFLNFYLELLPFCHLMVVTDGWLDSSGCYKEHSVAQELDIEVYHIDSVPKVKELI